MRDLSRDHHDFLVFCQALEREQVSTGRRSMMERRVADHAFQEATLATSSGFPCPVPATMATLRAHVQSCEKTWFAAIQDAQLDLEAWSTANRAHRRKHGLPVGSLAPRDTP